MIMNRRELIAGSIAAGGALLLRTSHGESPSGSPEPTSSSVDIFDVHHHLFPPAMVKTLAGKLPEMSLPGVERSLAELEAGGTATAMISYPNSDIQSLGVPRLVSLIRESNDYAATQVRDRPSRYGFFASLPMPAIDESLKEISYALDVLHAQGVLLISNYGGKWLGDISFEPVLAELNRRKSIVYVHPNAADCCRGLLGSLSDSIIEFQTDTTRTIASLLFSGAAERYGDIRFIFAHSGGTLPSLIERFTNAPVAWPELAKQVPRGVMTYLRRYYYDTAQTANPTALGGMLQLMPPDRFLFGTDFPWRHTAEQIHALSSMSLDSKVLAGILGANARQLFQMPRNR